MTRSLYLDSRVWRVFLHLHLVFTFLFVIICSTFAFSVFLLYITVHRQVYKVYAFFIYIFRKVGRSCLQSNFACVFREFKDSRPQKGYIICLTILFLLCFLTVSLPSSCGLAFSRFTIRVFMLMMSFFIMQELSNILIPSSLILIRCCAEFLLLYFLLTKTGDETGEKHLGTATN